MTARLSFTDLPAEILEAVFLHLDAHSLLAVSLANKPLQALTAASPLLWRHLCQTRFTTWDPRHNIAAKYRGPLSHVDWRAIFVARIQAAAHTKALLNRIVATQHERIRNINAIAAYGYDVQETLLEECACPDDVDDVLARRFYAHAALERIHRELAINIWRDLREGVDVPLEKALAAYDVFARVGPDVDTNVIAADLDHLAHAVLQRHPDFPTMHARAQASTLASFLRDQDYRGVPDTSFCALRNSFIGLVLRSPTHESLPLISVAIYCAVARRLGLDARPCGFLFHVYTIVYAPKNYNLDGEYKPTSASSLNSMYLDPFRSSDEVRQGDLRRLLRDTSVPPAEHATFLTDTTTREMVLRTARNIINSVQTIRQTEAAMTNIHPSWFTTKPDMDNAFYATIWVMLLLESPDDTSHSPPASISRRRQYLPYLLEHFQSHFPWDISLLLHYALPLFAHLPERHRLVQFAQRMHQLDATRRPVVRRTARTQHVRFHVGQLFHHKRYGYEGVITGWNVACEEDEEWIFTMDVDGLPRGRNQAFYHVLVCDKSVRYVAEENIGPVASGAQPSDPMMRIAGRHFKRWDQLRTMFVSNVRDEYPDD